MAKAPVKGGTLCEQHWGLLMVSSNLYSFRDAVWASSICP